jgi:hypothetical protein
MRKAWFYPTFVRKVDLRIWLRAANLPAKDVLAFMDETNAAIGIQEKVLPVVVAKLKVVNPAINMLNF